MLTNLPDPFLAETRRLLGDERMSRYLAAFDEEPPVSIRLNPLKAQRLEAIGGEPVGWCRDGYYLPCRPNFTMDPLLHAGCYYVQEAASMFLDEVVRQVIGKSVNGKSVNGKCLDLCAAPGGKSTLLRAALPAYWTLYSNEPVRQRASILAENVSKWGGEHHIVTSCYPRDYRRAKLLFDLVLCDVPCSGEGMFRKDAATIGEWSPAQVERCAALQRDIADDAWACLKDDGIMIYSTCTLNTRENEENIRWLLGEHDAETVAIDIRPEWAITGSLLEGFAEPVYRFIPGITRSEGLFVCVVRKRGGSATSPSAREASRRQARELAVLNELPLETMPSDAPRVDVGYDQAIAYLRREAIVLPDGSPRGPVAVSFQGHPLGMAKNIGTRANNLYPKEWRIKTTHTPTDYEAILRHTEQNPD